MRCKRKSHRGTLGRQGGALHISLGLTGTQRERERERESEREIRIEGGETLEISHTTYFSEHHFCKISAVRK